ncbi:hypothetical protein CVT26_004125 [Gymnopilus dilepis]|uniref:Uncharacterized protein n=1 Tax=Gymnopilus dilepis TaxID=231916 RepID=A0A409WTR5_9AGAR|nr:hypothetical protein CVT26_004125 [Gymnopilus dilepis]
MIFFIDTLKSSLISTLRLSLPTKYSRASLHDGQSIVKSPKKLSCQVNLMPVTRQGTKFLLRAGGDKCRVTGIQDF